MRRVVLQELIHDEDIENLGPLVEALAEIVANAWNHAGCHTAMTTLGDLLAYPDSIDHPRRASLYCMAKDMNTVELCRLFHDAPPHKDPPVYEPVPLSSPKRKGELTLGERKSQARNSLRSQLVRLLGDPDPTVIRELLTNPRLIEGDVLRIASRRPVRWEVLLEVFRSKRWLSYYKVKLALVLNPYSTPGLSIRLIHLLRNDDLCKVERDETLHPQVRLAAQGVLESRREGAGKC